MENGIFRVFCKLMESPPSTARLADDRVIDKELSRMVNPGCFSLGHGLVE